jgi:hypothetical protein
MKKIMILFLFAATFIGCKKSFFDINDNPNNPTDANISADLLAPGALATSGNISTGATYIRNQAGTAPFPTTTTRFSMLGRWLGVWSPGTNFAAGDESKYLAATNTSTADWRNRYDNINDYQTMQKKADATGQSFYSGIARIMKAWNFHQLVDLYNNVPYKEAANPDFIQPKYDNGAAIYADLFNEITAGINAIKSADIAKNIKITSADVMFKGDKVKWAKFGNTLKLRLIIHQSQTPNAATIASTQLAIIDAEGSGYLNAGETAQVNPGYTAANSNPYWTTHMYGNGCTPIPDNFNRANNFSLKTMKLLNDQRFKQFYLPVRGKPGTSDDDWQGIDYAPTNSDPNFTEGKLSDIGGARTCVSGGTLGLGKSPDMASWIITGFESLFLQAEARARGWITSGPTADVLYSRAVTESFSWLGIAASAAPYLAQSDVRIAWPAAQVDQIKVISWQKYFAFNGNNHIEMWNDYRRLGVVNIALSVDPGRLSNPIPVRLEYPESEYSFNKENAIAQGSINVFTSKVFWNQ